MARTNSRKNTEMKKCVLKVRIWMVLQDLNVEWQQLLGRNPEDFQMVGPADMETRDRAKVDMH